MCIIIDFDKCDQIVYKSFLEKHCNSTIFEKELELRADVEHILTRQFKKLSGTNAVSPDISAAIQAYWNEDPVTVKI